MSGGRDDARTTTAHLREADFDRLATLNLARRVETDPEQALRAACRKFERRFRRVGALLAEAGRSAEDSSLEELEALWQRAKAEERRG